MLAYLINLDHHCERLAHMEREFSRVRIQFVRVSGVDGYSMSQEQVEMFRAARSGQRSKPHPWHPGQIGCFLSHVAVWKRIAGGSEDVAAVFEDDVHLSNSLPRVMADLSWLPPDADVVRLETTLQGMRLDRPAHDEKAGTIAIRRVRRGGWGTAGYIIRRNVAKWLANSLPHCQVPTDYFLFHNETSLIARLLRVYQLDPAICVQNQYHPTVPHSLNFLSDTYASPRLGQSGVKRRGIIERAVKRSARVFLRRHVVPFLET